jgi:predicted TPR repeat methyltransferase
MMDAAEALKRAVEHHRAGQQADAEQIYLELLNRQPDNPNALNLLGMIRLEQHRHEEAAELVLRAIGLAPSVAGFHNNLGNIRQAQFRDADAAAAYRIAVNLNPDYFEAHNNLGVALLGQGLVNDAIACFVRAIEIAPRYPAARNNLGNALRARAQFPEALACYEDAIALDATYYQPRSNKAIALLAMGRLPDAEQACRAAIALDPAKIDAYVTLGMTMEEARRPSDAIDCYRTALNLRPQSHHLRFNLAALTGEGGFDAAPPEFVRNLFDRYAESFDRHLVDVLSYRAPQLLLDAVQAAFDSAPPAQSLDIADLGCGTGLCGPLFKPLARSLIGVDLSANMISRSRTRGVYDELIIAELVEFLRERCNQFDLAVASDVLNYFGDLRNVVAAAFGALRPRGLLTFTLERHDQAGYALYPTRRYGHGINYIRAVSGAAGFQEISADTRTLRTQTKKDVPGWIMVLQKPPAP